MILPRSALKSTVRNVTTTGCQNCVTMFSTLLQPVVRSPLFVLAMSCNRWVQICPITVVLNDLAFLQLNYCWLLHVQIYSTKVIYLLPPLWQILKVAYLYSVYLPVLGEVAKVVLPPFFSYESLRINYWFLITNF